MGLGIKIYSPIMLKWGVPVVHPIFVNIIGLLDLIYIGLLRKRPSDQLIVYDVRTIRTYLYWFAPRESFG